MYFPSRGGVRGGQDQFNWEDIKTDKFRENYLGHSVKAPVGRWQKGKDLAWYSKKNDPQERSRSLAALKRAEEEALSAALGHRPIKKDNHQLSKDELAEVLKRGQVERSGLEIERIEGMGYSGIRAGIAPKGGMNFQMMGDRSELNDSESQLQSLSKNTTESAVASVKSTKDEHRKSPKKKRKSKKRKSKHSSSSNEDVSEEESSKEREKEDKSQLQRKENKRKDRSRSNSRERKQKHDKDKHTNHRKGKSKKRRRRHSTDESD